MKDPVLISVIVPVYKVQDYLKECIDSILHQSYKNFELILVDDESPDDCGKICDEYSRKDSRIKVIHKKNGGLSDARNAGIEIASGEYIAFVDSDDFIRDTYLERMMSLAQEYQADLVACNFIWAEEFVSWGDSEKIIVYKEDEVLEHRFVDDAIMTVAWNKLYHKKFFKELNLKYPKGKIHEDNFLSPTILYYSRCMVITKDELYFYRIRNNSIVNAGFSIRNLDKIEAIEQNLQFYTRIGREKLYFKELDSYLRNLMKYIVWMKNTDSVLYEDNIRIAMGKLSNTFKKNIFHKNIKFKLRIKTGMFLLKERKVGNYDR